MKEIYKLMMDEYREACRDYYEDRFGCKLNCSYTIKNEYTGEVVTGSVSGARTDEKSEAVMRAIRRLMEQIFGEQQVRKDIVEIRREKREEEKDFFKTCPEFVQHVTDIR